jgi:hypothetical protein
MTAAAFTIPRSPSVKSFTSFKCFRRNGHHSLCISAFCQQKRTVLSGRSRAGRATLGRTGTTLAGRVPGVHADARQNADVGGDSARPGRPATPMHGTYRGGENK